MSRRFARQSFHSPRGRQSNHLRNRPKGVRAHIRVQLCGNLRTLCNFLVLLPLPRREGLAQHTRSDRWLRLGPPPSLPDPWSPIIATNELLSNFAISRAYRSPCGHGGVAKSNGDGMVPSEVLLGDLSYSTKESTPR